MKSHVAKSSLLKNYGELDFKTLQKERYILKTCLQGSLGRKVSQIEISLKNQRWGWGGGWGGRNLRPPPMRNRNNCIIHAANY